MSTPKITSSPLQMSLDLDLVDLVVDRAKKTPFPVQISIQNPGGERTVQHAEGAYEWTMPDEVEGKIERAERALTQVMRKGMPVCVSWSAGKDSSTVLNLLLSAASKMSERGESVPPIVVTHADTMIENPEMVLYARNEMTMVDEFARKHKLNVTIEISTPNLTDQWAVRVIGGRALPPFPGTNRDCSMDFKALPMKRLRKKVLKQLEAHCAKGADREPVVLIGTRYDESAERSRNMRERGESDIQIRRGVDENGRASHLFLSPVAYWSSDDIWEYLGTARCGAIPAYSNFEDTFRVYADAMGQSCVIVAEDMSKSMKAAKACGARHGCSLCTAVGKDASMENMLSMDDRYAYMKGLNELRNFLAATRWDADRRSWLGRTINEGHIRVAPDAYSPNMMEELLRYSLTIDMQEQEASRRAGLSQPRFQLVNIEQLFAIDAMWSLQAFHKPFHALKIYDDICNKGHRFPVPELDTFPRWKDTPAKYLHVGADWDEGEKNTYTGLRSVIHELVRSEGDGCMGNRILSNGKEVMSINTATMLEFDIEACFFILDEIDELMAKHHDNPRSNPTQAYMYYATLGCMTVKAGMEGEIDTMLRRSAFKVRQGLDGEIVPADLLARAVTAEEAGLAASTNGKLRKKGADGSKSVVYASLSEEKQLEAVVMEDGDEEVQSSRKPARLAM